MSREVRRVPANWQHPKNEHGNYKPLFSGDQYKSSAAEFLEKANSEGLQEALDYFGQAPDAGNYMPAWTEEEKTHFMMYETTSEGTPISQAFETPEQLAQWLFDTGASAFGRQTDSYEDWLNIAKGGYAPSLVLTNSTLITGVEFSIQPEI